MTPLKIGNRQSEIVNFAAAIDFIQSLDQLGTPRHSQEYHFTQGIARARHVLHRLGGAPHATAHCVLVAGSKGKGSTAAMLSSVLAEAGHRVGAFTGPHLHTPLERFAILAPLRVGEGAMPEHAFVDCAGRVRDIVATWDRPDLGLPTRFEAFTAIAYRWFEEQRTSINVMEIGIGGRLDAVNLADPMLSVITNISLEHTQILGDTTARIAREKAGIMRAGKPVIIARQTEEVLGVLCDEAAHRGAVPALAEEGWHCEPVSHRIDPECSGQWFIIPGKYDDRAFFLPLLGAYQLQNAAAVLAACDALRHTGMDLSEQALRQGMARTRWRGRFELIGFDPIVIADGAHTPYSMQQLCAALRDYFPDRRIHFIVGILRDKDSYGMLEAIAATATSVTLCDMPVRRATSAGQLLTQWNDLPEPRVTALLPSLAAGLQEALRHTRAIASPDDVICITGSLHLVAEAEEFKIEN